MIDVLTSGAVPETVTMMLSLVDPGIADKLAAGLSTDDAYKLLATMPIELRAALRPEILDPGVITASLLAAHIIIFWVSQDSNVTPPVCLPAFVATAIAKSPPMATGFAAFRLCKGLYIIPLLFAFTPLLSGEWSERVMVFIPAMVGLHALSAAMSGILERPLGLIGRKMAALFGIVLLWPLSWPIKGAALLVYLGWVLWDWRLRRAAMPRPAGKAGQVTA